MARPAPAASRGIEILNFLVAHPTRSYTLSQLARQLGINVASAHAVLSVLEGAGYVVRQAAPKSYRLGPLLVAAGQATMERYPAIGMAREEIEALARSSGVEFAVTIAAGPEIVVLSRAGPRHAGGLDVGGRIPLIPPLGSVFLAWGTPEERRAWLSRARPAAASQELTQLQTALDTVRARGYSVALRPTTSMTLADAIARSADQDLAESRRAIHEVIEELGQGEYHLGEMVLTADYNVTMIAAPVFDEEGQVLLSIAASAFPGSLPAARVLAWAERLRDVALKVTRQSGGHAPDPA